ncbi:MAG TPA: cation:proton antiporter [Burkholderiaceae bacterium]|nr:cation:proton antiporter [Burkholderiaceae bacterium]
MGNELHFLIQSMAWPLVLLAAWAVGDVAYNRWHIPRVSSYVAVGMVVGTVNLPNLTPDIAGLPFLADVALALVLFELGYRINLRWFRANPWVLLAGVVESLLTFAVVFWLLGLLDDFRLHVRLAVAALAMASSPAGILRVVHELRSTGQVTERVMHLTAINCLLSVLALKLVMGSRTFRVSGDWMEAAFGSLHVLATSVAVGMLLGFLVPKLLKGRMHAASEGATVVFALAVLLLVTAASGLKLSPLLAALTFGIVARERRVHLTQTQRNFGSAGDLLSVFLFVYVASLLDWNDVFASIELGLWLVVARSAVFVAVNMATARVSGITYRKGLMTGLALTPMSAFVVLMVGQSGVVGFDLAERTLSTIAGMVLVLELFGPLVTQRALMAAREAHVSHDS